MEWKQILVVLAFVLLAFPAQVLAVSTWTGWMNVDQPAGVGDYETVQNIRNAYPPYAPARSA